MFIMENLLKNRWFGAPPILRKSKMHVKLVALPQERFKLAKYLIGVVGPEGHGFGFLKLFQSPENTYVFCLAGQQFNPIL